MWPTFQIALLEKWPTFRLAFAAISFLFHLVNRDLVNYDLAKEGFDIWPFSA